LVEGAAAVEAEAAVTESGGGKERELRCGKVRNVGPK
jgi:hypothetical protein